MHGLQNLQPRRDQSAKEGSYAVRHGVLPVNDFGRSRKGEGEERPFDPDRENFWENAFAILFPYGRGGLEADRATLLSLADHVRPNLQLADRRFRTHETYLFVAFGLLQRLSP